MTEASPIHDVSDTAFWVAHYRALETKQKSPLFHDPFAEILAGEKGQVISKKMRGGKLTSWIVVLRTHIIDNFIEKCIRDENIDAVLNIGAGLDARPYRLHFPKPITWIEVDYPKTIEFKQGRLREFKPRVRLEQRGIDVADRSERIKLLDDVSARFNKILVLTEGVIPYLSNEQVADLGKDLRDRPSYAYWILEYFVPKVLEQIKKRRKHQMKNAPFLFGPSNWHDFFRDLGWTVKDLRYFSIESEQLNRRSPLPLHYKILQYFMPLSKREEFKKHSGFALLTTMTGGHKFSESR